MKGHSSLHFKKILAVYLSGIDVQGYVWMKNLGIQKAMYMFILVEKSKQPKVKMMVGLYRRSLRGRIMANRTDYATTYFPNSPHPDQSLPCLEEECLVTMQILFFHSNQP